MDSNGSPISPLTRDECLRLLATVPIGRIVYTRQALPAVEVVNFVLEGGEIVIKTDSGGKLAAATHGAVVAFEADRVDFATRIGWSVTVVGKCRALTDDDEIERLKDTGPHPWAPGSRDHFIAIAPVIATGRTIGAHRATARSGS